MDIPDPCVEFKKLFVKLWFEGEIFTTGAEIEADSSIEDTTQRGGGDKRSSVHCTHVYVR